MLFTFCVYLIGNSLETIVKVLLAGEFVQAIPAYVGLMNGITWFFPNLCAFDLKANLAYGLPYDSAYLIWTGLYGCAYTFLMLLFTLMVFKRKDIC